MAVVGGTQMQREGVASRPMRCVADVSAEAILASLTGERDVPRRLVEEMAKLPAERPLLILRPVQDVRTSLPAYLVAHQAMPRPALIREARLADSAAAVAEMRKRFAAVIFVGQSPPTAFPAGRSFGDSFVFVPL
jgi:hypothetical protein